MLLQALYNYYQILRNDPDIEIAEPGYSNAPVSHALNLSAQGELLDIIPLYVQDQKGKERPRQMNVPMRIKRSVNVAANFLCDNPVYVLGITDKEAKDPDYAKKRFEEFRKHNLEILAKVDSPAARAITTFLKNHDPLKATQIPVVARHLESLLQGRNLIFLVEGKNTLDDPKIRQAWEEYHLGHETLEMQCLVTGEIEPVARLHPDIKGVWGAQKKGAALVSFNLDAFTSYGREQGLNSPVSRRAAAGYAVALNYLLSRRDPRPLHTSDTTVVFWAESESRQTEAVFACLFDPDSLPNDDGRLRRGGQAEGILKDIAERVRGGKPLDLDALLADLGDENPRFYVLGLAPNASRLAVRFFITDPFRQMVENVMAHYRDLQIVKEYPDQPTYLSPWRLLNETVSQKSSDKTPQPLLGGAVMRAILQNTPYPAALYNAVITRVRADMDDREKHISKINYARAAIIKAYLLRKYRHQPQNPIQEVLTMALNEQSSHPAYLLGRLFAVLEKVQAEAIGEMNASIKDRYFTSACAAPASVFPILLRLSQHHIAKAQYGYASERLIQDILNKLDVENNPIPARLTLDEQGVFILGYYHQRAAFYQKKTDAPENPQA